MKPAAFDAYVVSALFDRSGRAIFALGDGTVRFEDGAVVQAHPDAGALCAVAHPSGQGVVTGGDDGRLVWSRADGSTVVLAEAPGGRWIDAVDASSESGLIAFATGREARVVDAKDPKFLRVFPHERAVASVALDPKGRRLACATYGGATLWFARIESQQPTWLKWAGAHTLCAFSPDGKFLITAMQENELHGWRLADSKTMRMGGYPAKTKSLAFVGKGLLMGSSGAQGAVVWPFRGNNGPMGENAAEIGFSEAGIVTRVAGAPNAFWLAGGTDDGRVWAAELRTTRHDALKSEKGAPITALAMSVDARRVAWGDEDGQAGVFDLEG